MGGWPSIVDQYVFTCVETAGIGMSACPYDCHGHDDCQCFQEARMTSTLHILLQLEIYPPPTPKKNSAFEATSHINLCATLRG